MNITTSSVSLTASTTKIIAPIQINNEGPLSLQPISKGIIGTLTYTVEVSNELTSSSFVTYDVLATDVSIDDSIQINHETIPWDYVRILVTSGASSSGIVYFNIFTNG